MGIVAYRILQYHQVILILTKILFILKAVIQFTNSNLNLHQITKIAKYKKKNYLQTQKTTIFHHFLDS